MNDVRQRLAEALVNRYRIERELGQGGMAVVYLAHDLKHGRPVALKVLRSELAATLGSDRFLQEIRLTAQLQHPHILPLHDSGAVGNLLYYVMPYVDGESLRDRLRRENQLPVRDALHIAREVADALSYAHDKHVVHRDIKPENIMLSGDHAVVTDFGIAQAIRLAGEVTIVAGDSVSGTPTYMSPEQASGGSVDARSDVYSLACVLYEMLVGRPPFSDVTSQGLMRKILSDPPPSLSRQRDTVAEPIEQAVLAALSKLPADRPSNIKEFVSLLGDEPDTGRLATVRTSPVRADEVTRPSVTAARTGARRIRPSIAGLLFFGVGVLVLGLTFLLVRLFGLPDWVFPGAAALLLVGFPVVLVTSVIQARLHSDTALARAASGAASDRHWLTWRMALMGGVLAFAVWGLVVAGYMASRKLGVGPGASLVSAGIMENQSDVLIAEFENRTKDALLGEALKEALSVDLAQSTAIRVVARDRVVKVLGRMERDPNTVLTLDLAREVAERDGIRAVVAGQIVPTGSSYVLSVRLIATESGEALTAHRETAKDDSELIDAVDRLSYRLRERIGESLKTIRSEKSLAQVTTGSLEALRKYSAAIQAEDYHEDSMRAIELLREATVLDSTFAMAWRKLAVILSNNGMDQAQVLDAVTRAYELRDHLTPREHYLAVGYYHSTFSEHEKSIRAYENLLSLDPEDTYALNNLSVAYLELQNHEKALDYARRAQAVQRSPNHFQNQIAALVGLGRFEEAEVLYQEMRAFSNNPQTMLFGAWLAFAQRDYELVQSRVDEVAPAAQGNPFLVRQETFLRASLLTVQGRLADAEPLTEIGLEAQRNLGDPGGLMTILLYPAYLEILVRERPDRVPAIVNLALQQVPLNSLDPENRPYLDLAELYAMIGDTGNSREYLEEYRRAVDPRIQRAQEPQYHFALGALALAEGKARSAIDELLTASRKGHWPLNTLLGRAYDAAGVPDSALVEYEKSINTPVLWRVFIDPENLGPSYFRVAQLYEEQGNFSKAIEYYSRFSELWQNADPDLQPRVAAARARIHALTAESAKS